MALGLTQPLVKMGTRNTPGGKGGRCVRLTTSPPSYAECHENLGSLNLLEPSGPHRACYRAPLTLLIFVDLRVYSRIISCYEHDDDDVSEGFVLKILSGIFSLPASTTNRRHKGSLLGIGLIYVLQKNN